MTNDEPLRLFPAQQQAAEQLLRTIAESEESGLFDDPLSLLVQEELEQYELNDDELSLVAAGQKRPVPPLHLPKTF